MVQGGQPWLKLGDELSNPILVASSLRMTRKLFNLQILGVQKGIFWSEYCGENSTFEESQAIRVNYKYMISPPDVFNKS